MQQKSISSFITTLVIFVIILFSSFVGFVVISEILSDIENFKTSEIAIINHSSIENSIVDSSYYRYEHPVNALNQELCEINKKTFEKLKKQLSCVISGINKIDKNNPIYAENVDAIDIYKSYFLDKRELNLILVDKVGSIIIDTKKMFGGNFAEFKDSSNNWPFKKYVELFESKIIMQFSSYWRTKDDVKILFTYMEPILNYEYYLGINIYSDEYHNEIINKIINRMELAVSEDLDFSGYKIVNKEGYLISSNHISQEKIVITKNKVFGNSELEEYKKNWYKNKWNEDTVGSQLIRYTFVPSMDWFVYYELNDKNYQDSILMKEIIEKKHRVLSRIICLLLISILAILILAFIIIGKFTKKINSQFSTISDSIIGKTEIDLNKIGLSEFNGISSEINELIKIANRKIEIVEKPTIVKKQSINEEYLMNILQFAFTNSNNLSYEHSEFLVSKAIEQCLDELKNMQLSVHNVELVCDDYLKIDSNRNAFMGILKFFVCNLLILNNDLINKGVITIEIIGDEKLMYLSISRDLSVNTQSNIDFNIFDKLEEIHDIVEEYSNGLLDYNEYEFSSRKVLIRFPKM